MSDDIVSCEVDSNELRNRCGNESGLTVRLRVWSSNGDIFRFTKPPVAPNRYEDRTPHLLELRIENLDLVASPSRKAHEYRPELRIRFT